jgi:hypothetical protein
VLVGLSPARCLAQQQETPALTAAGCLDPLLLLLLLLLVLVWLQGVHQWMGWALQLELLLLVPECWHHQNLQNHHHRHQLMGQQLLLQELAVQQQLCCCPLLCCSPLLCCLALSARPLLPLLGIQLVQRQQLVPHRSPQIHRHHLHHQWMCQQQMAARRCLRDLLLLLPLLALLLLFRCHQQLLQLLALGELPLMVLLQILLPQSLHARLQGCLTLNKGTQQQHVSTTKTINSRLLLYGDHR